jgi:hypothetical protein
MVCALACTREGPTGPTRNRTQYRFRLPPPPREKPVASLPLLGVSPSFSWWSDYALHQKHLSAFAPVDPIPLLLRGLAVPIAAAEDLVR